MKALIVDEHGPVENLRLAEVADPAAQPGQVLVDVKAVSVNFPDLLLIDGTYQNLPALPFSPGKDLAGDVVAVGEGVADFKPGDRVCAQVEFGAYAEKCVVPQAYCHVLPDRMSYTDAAAMGLTYLTAYFALLERGGMRAGETVLVTGAAGGVGLACVQIAKAFGAIVVAAVGSDDKAAQAQASGADHIIRTDVEDLRTSFRKQMHDAVGTRGAELIIDMVGGDVFDASLRAIAWSGRLVIVGFAAGRIPEIKAGYILVKNIALLGLQVTDYRDREPSRWHAAQQALFDLYQRGLVKPHVMACFPLEAYRQALGLVAQRKVVGKVVFNPAAGV
jgi:NADPH2:quinone reductase